MQCCLRRLVWFRCKVSFIASKMLFLVLGCAQGHRGTPHWKPRWSVLLITSPLVSSYSAKPNSCSRVRRHLSDLVSINSHIRFGNRLWQYYFRNQIPPRWFYWKGFFLFLELWDLMETSGAFHTAKFPSVMSQGTRLKDWFTFLLEGLEFSSPVMKFCISGHLGRDNIDQMIKGSIGLFPLMSLLFLRLYKKGRFSAILHRPNIFSRVTFCFDFLKLPEAAATTLNKIFVHVWMTNVSAVPGTIFFTNEMRNAYRCLKTSLCVCSRVTLSFIHLVRISG